MTVGTVGRAWPLCLAALCCLLPASAHAFDSYPPGAPHDRITQQACKALELPRATSQRLCAAVRYVDRSESRWDPSWSPRTWLRFRPNARYRPAHHFDRPRATSDADAFASGSDHVRAQLAAASASVDRRGPTAARTALGAALHAVQDLVAHSNLVDLPAASVDSVERALWDGAAAPSALLRLTGYDPAARDPESPPGDTYSHRDHAKDSARKNAESQLRMGAESKFERAERMATTLSIGVLELVRAAVSGEAWQVVVAR